LRVERWLAGAVPDSRGPHGFRLVAAGGSNLTFELTDAGGRRWALRRPPVGRALATAHDLLREWTGFPPTPTTEQALPSPSPGPSSRTRP
ncbi:MAG: hypothetical protein ABW009_09725, partial [Acidimicrobiales bacterium]